MEKFVYEIHLLLFRKKYTYYCKLFMYFVSRFISKIKYFTIIESNAKYKSQNSATGSVQKHKVSAKRTLLKI